MKTRLIDFLCLTGLIGLLISGCDPNTDPQAAFEAGNYAEARELWLPLAEAGDAEAQNAVGTIYYLGLGVERNYRKALEWFEQAAKQGHSRAQRNLGMLYMDGHGTGQDYLKAYTWFYAADKQGNQNADAYINSLVNKLTPNQQIKARRTAAPFIINPTVDYVPEHDLPQIDPQVEDLRESDDSGIGEAG